jgi:hypothetical protein
MGEWITQNKAWLLDGLGVFVLGLFVTFIGWLIKKKNTSSDGGINQSMGNNVRAGKVTFTNNKQIVNKKTDSREE